MLIISNIGDHVWLMTSRQTDPELEMLEVDRYWGSILISHLVDVRVKYAVDKADARTFVWILVRQLDMNLPEATFERCYRCYKPAVTDVSCV